MTLTAILALAVGTYLIRLAGPLLRDSLTMSEEMQEFLKTAAVVLLVALIVSSSVPETNTPHAWALPAGVAVGGVLAWLKAPFAIVVVSAAAATGVLRYLLGMM